MIVIKCLFLIYALAAFVGGSMGATHQFGLSVLCFIVAGAFWLKDRKEKRVK